MLIYNLRCVCGWHKALCCRPAGHETPSGYYWCFINVSSANKRLQGDYLVSLDSTCSAICFRWDHGQGYKFTHWLTEYFFTQMLYIIHKCNIVKCAILQTLDSFLHTLELSFLRATASFRCKYANSSFWIPEMRLLISPLWRETWCQIVDLSIGKTRCQTVQLSSMDTWCPIVGFFNMKTLFASLTWGHHKDI